MQKVVPETEQVFVRLSSNGKRYGINCSSYSVLRILCRFATSLAAEFAYQYNMYNA